MLARRMVVSRESMAAAERELKINGLKTVSSAGCLCRIRTFATDGTEFSEDRQVCIHICGILVHAFPVTGATSAIAFLCLHFIRIASDCPAAPLAGHSVGRPASPLACDTVPPLTLLARCQGLRRSSALSLMFSSLSTPHRRQCFVFDASSPIFLWTCPFIVDLLFIRPRPIL
jgi:hypothetical protein